MDHSLFSRMMLQFMKDLIVGFQNACDEKLCANIFLKGYMVPLLHHPVLFVV